jgi:predicted kinase
MNKPKAIVIYGPPCAGKSSLCTVISNKTGCKILSTDLIRLEYFITSPDMYNSTKTNMIYDRLFEQVRENIKANHSVIIEGMFLTEKTKSRILEFYDITELKLVYVTASLATLKKRLLLRNDINSDNILQQKVPLSEKELERFYLLSVPPKDKTLVIDTTNKKIELSSKQLESIICNSFSYSALLNNLMLNK